MEYQTIFNVGDKVYFLTRQNRIVPFIVEHISVHHYTNGKAFVLYMDLHNGRFGDCHDVFKTMESARKEQSYRRKCVNDIYFTE